MADFTINLPVLPPSVNQMHRTNYKTKSRYSTKQYKDWQAMCALCVRYDGEPIADPVSVSISLVRPDRRRRDIDNLLKPLLDLLVRSGLLADDSFVHDLHIKWATKPQVDPVYITVATITEP